MHTTGNANERKMSNFHFISIDKLAKCRQKLMFTTDLAIFQRSAAIWP